MRTARRRHGLLYLATALTLASFAALAPRRSAGAANETFFTGPSPCPVAHCNQHLDGREGMANGTILAIPLS